MNKTNIVLIGMPGTSKSTCGKILAKKKNMLFYDSDGIFTEQFGSISAFFAAYGEDLFRVEEGKILYLLSAKKETVISCGGGAVLNPACMNKLKESGTVVLLTANAETIEQRLKDDVSRPLLKGNAKKNIEMLWSQRKPLYLKYADVAVPTDGLSPEEIADKISSAVENAKI